MKKNLKTQFLTRQYMLSRDYELYYYSDGHMANVDSHAHDYYISVRAPRRSASRSMVWSWESRIVLSSDLWIML